MRALTYNILNGGTRPDPARLESVIGVIKAARPDILGVQEAMNFDEDGSRLLYRFETELGLRGTLATTATGQHVGLFVPPQTRIVALYHDVIHFHHAMIRCVIETSAGERVTCIVTHLCPHGGENRLRETQYLTNFARLGEAVLIMGDLNALSPHDAYVGALRDLPSHYRARHLLPPPSEGLDTRALGFLELAGFRDLHFSAGTPRHTAPTRNGIGGGEFRQMRVDYILATPPLAERAMSCEVVTSEDADGASDHYPLVAEFAFDL